MPPNIVEEITIQKQVISRFRRTHSQEMM